MRAKRAQIGAVAISKQMIVLTPNLILKRHALRVVFLKPCLSSDLARNDPQVIAVANLLAGVDVDLNGH